jgi:hypothetical protein
MSSPRARCWWSMINMRCNFFYKSQTFSNLRLPHLLYIVTFQKCLQEQIPWGGGKMVDGWYALKPGALQSCRRKQEALEDTHMVQEPANSTAPFESTKQGVTDCVKKQFTGLHSLFICILIDPCHTTPCRETMLQSSGCSVSHYTAPLFYMLPCYMQGTPLSCALHAACRPLFATASEGEKAIIFITHDFQTRKVPSMQLPEESYWNPTWKSGEGPCSPLNEEFPCTRGVHIAPLPVKSSTEFLAPETSVSESIWQNLPLCVTIDCKYRIARRGEICNRRWH